jgi:hypothetical protein
MEFFHIVDSDIPRNFQDSIVFVNLHGILPSIGRSGPLPRYGAKPPPSTEELLRG